MLELDLSDFINHVRQAIQQDMPPPASQVVIVPGSYNPADGTVTVWSGLDLAAQDEEGNLVGPTEFGPYPLLTPGLGVQAPPVGWERAVAFPTEGGWAVAIVHYDDSPGIAPGEYISRLYTDTNTKVYLKRDTPTAGSLHATASTEIEVNAPLVFLGESQSAGNDGVVRFQDLQDALTNITQAFQQALNTLASQVQPGSGVTAPSVDTPQATSSVQVFSK